MKQERSRRTRDRILDAAAAEFAEHGYVAANLQHVAERAMLTKGAVYGHFASKADIATLMADHFERRVQAVITADLRRGGADADIWHRVSALTSDLVHQVTSDRRSGAALRLGIEEVLAGSPEPQALSRLRAHLASFALPEDGAADGPPSSGPALADVVLAAVVGMYYTAPMRDHGSPPAPPAASAARPCATRPAAPPAGERLTD